MLIPIPEVSWHTGNFAFYNVVIPGQPLNYPRQVSYKKTRSKDESKYLELFFMEFSGVGLAHETPIYGVWY